MSGWLVTVVGPSGAGKDTLLAGVRHALRDDARFVFVRRAITRPAEPAGQGGAEDHVPMTEAEFLQARDAGSFAMHWFAHGLHYGIPATIRSELDAGRTVIANLSRGVLAEAHEHFPLKVISITAPAAILAARLAGRGRESAEDIAARLARSVALPPGVDVVEVPNDTTPEEGAARLLAALRSLPG
ncbi:phosphonate metabolism protein/1,5-bisphosphokinase (PRPP-forming) PhnN [Roseomonas haemaphysalidis]|uniref:Ribose 1,5-bisphosphate phosphokinase PhnN n=1 Tax=Roseomonas haemaphysalidis TaxID=2768162 RepID=A0ABS3KWF3_9PROT|nr:phosphonate metabolism protein/1,5-bisphosphokinase (PRPP-forming) PhnN [Roseomonas haemaphysalidis]MBO1081769.1 phosphonate metabolism protein/1,5-bisphosphokinase (PRPP-forming) PhnN [Roseomonas haemaphysalidis]